MKTIKFTINFVCDDKTRIMATTRQMCETLAFCGRAAANVCTLGPEPAVSVVPEEVPGATLDSGPDLLEPEPREISDIADFRKIYV